MTRTKDSRNGNGPVFLLTFLLCLVLVHTVLGQLKVIEPISRALWGSSKTHCTDGNYLYIGAGGAIIMCRLVASDSIVILNEYYLPSTVQDIVIRDNVLYVSDLLTGLHIVDVSDVLQPREIGNLTLPHRSYGLLLDSTDLFVSHGDNGFSRVNITDNVSPALLDEMPYTCTRFRLYSSYLYCFDQNQITILTRSTLDSIGSLPVNIRTPFGNEIVGLEFSRSKGFLVENYFGDLPGDQWSYLTILDLSAPGNPQRSGALKLPPQHAFKNRGDTVFCFIQDSLFIVDGSSLNHPFLLSRFYGVAGDFVSVWDTMLLASRDYNAEFQVVDIKDINDPKKGFYLSTLADVGSIVAADSFLVAGRFTFAGLMLVDIKDIDHPRTSYVYTDSIGSVRDLRFSDGHIFAATEQGLKVFNVVGLDSLSLIGGLNYGTWAMRMDVSDTLAALGGGYSQLHLISVKDPTQPKYLLQIPSSSFGYVQNIIMRDTLLFVCGDYAGVRVYSIASPNQPVTLWQHYYATCEAIYPFGATLLVADFSTLRAFDISTPTNPVEIGSYNCGNRIIGISVSDSMALVSVFSNGYTQDNGMLILDLHRSRLMQPIAQAAIPGWPNAIFSNGRFVFLSDHPDGVYIYDLTDLVTDVSDDSVRLPTGYELFQNFPNPFNPATTIHFELPKDSHVRLKLYNLLGQEIMTLADGDRTAGVYDVRVDGSKLVNGVYFYKLTAGAFVQTKKMVVVR